MGLGVWDGGGSRPNNRQDGGEGGHQAGHVALGLDRLQDAVSHLSHNGPPLHQLLSSHLGHLAIGNLQRGGKVKAAEDRMTTLAKQVVNGSTQIFLGQTKILQPPEFSRSSAWLQTCSAREISLKGTCTPLYPTDLSSNSLHVANII